MPDNQKIEEFEYGIIQIAASQVLALVDCIDLLEHSFPIPRDMRARIETKLLPRLQEIQDFIRDSGDVPETVGVEITRLNKDDILYGLKSVVIIKGLDERGYDVGTLLAALEATEFQRC